MTGAELRKLLGELDHELRVDAEHHSHAYGGDEYQLGIGRGLAEAAGRLRALLERASVETVKA